MKDQLRRASLIVVIALGVTVAVAACTPLPPGAIEALTNGSPLPTAPASGQPAEVQPPTAAPEPMAWTRASEAGCISVMSRLTPTEAVRAVTSGTGRQFDSRAEAEEWVYPDTGPWHSGFRDLIVAGRVDGLTFVWEDLGFECSDPAAAKRASRNGTFVSMYWNSDASTALTLAENGRVSEQAVEWSPPTTTEWKRLAQHGAIPVSDEVWGADPVAGGLVVQSEIMGLDAMADPAWQELPGVSFWGVGF